ncbi:hypothetical protein DXG01_015842 [Tephrocybe rancida]|nr:hypothetical protein DXG01_015842 [Tephrocybe rancida]
MIDTTDPALSAPFRPEDCTFEFTKQWNEDPNIITYIQVKARHPVAGTCSPDPSDDEKAPASQAGEVGTMLFVRILRRAFQRGGFHTFMDDHHADLENLSSSLFNDNGRLKPGVLDGVVHRGTGVWGNELNQGEIVFILEMDVKEQFQSQGLGTAMLSKLLATQRVQVADNVMCWPCPTGKAVNGISCSEYDALKNRQISFFRKNGFRRIGHTPFFGYSPNPTHPSHMIAAAADANEKPKEELPGLSSADMIAMIGGM